MEQFDVIVIGTGVAGQTAASELAEAGKRVAVVDRREFGGTCALRGCEPKKVLFTAAEAAERAAAQAGNGLTGAVSVDWRSLVAFKRTFTDPVPTRIETWLAESGAVPLHGPARFVSEDTVLVGPPTSACSPSAMRRHSEPRSRRSGSPRPASRSRTSWRRARRRSHQP